LFLTTTTDLSNGAISNDLERPLPQVSRSRHSLTLNISNGTTYRHSFNEILTGTYTCPTQQCHFKWPWRHEASRGLRQLTFLFSYRLAFDAPVRGALVPVGVLLSRLVRKTGGATQRWKNFEDNFMYNRLDRIPACYRQTDGQTDRDILTSCHGVVRAMHASRGKK